LVIISGEEVGAGLAGFKGIPDAAGVTEIGYGIAPSYQNKGYMSEAIRALVDWALSQPTCKAVTATTVENPASRRLLEKLGARLVTEDAASTSWEFRQ
jgi:ribosomal-protein-alanine N-acetyltransferase